MVVCPDCGKEVSHDKFCKNCGAYLGDVQEIEVIESQSAENLNEAAVSCLDDDVDEKTSAENLNETVQSNIESDFKYCFNCGAKLTGNFRFCPACGQDLNSNITGSGNNQVVRKDKNTLLAVILSVLLPGLGQIYLGLDNKGAILLIAYVISAILILFFIGIILVIILWIWALVDTIISANALSHGDEVEDKLF